MKKVNILNILLTLFFMASTFLLQAQVPENGLVLDGVDDYISVPSLAGDEFNPEFDLTLECWVNLNEAAAMGVHRPHLITKLGVYGLVIEESGYARFFLFTDSVWYATADYTTDIINPGLWYHLAATYDGAVARLYLNGVEQATVTINDTLFQNAENIRIGSFDMTGGVDNTAGMFEEVRIWNVTRTPAEIQDNMNRTIPGSSAGLAGYWRLDESSGTNADDQTALNNDGTLTNMTVPAAWQTSTGPVGEVSIFAESADITETAECAVDVDFMDGGEGPGPDQSLAVMQVNALPNSLSGLYSERAGLYWEIWSEDPDFDSDFTADVRFHYDDVSGLPNENSLELFRRDDATGTWTAATGYVIVTNDGGLSTATDGIGYVELTITDGTTGAFSGQYILSWSNEPPVVSDIPDQSVAEGSAFATITLDNYVTDPDNGDSEITWTATGEDNVSVVITDRVATITADNPEWNGSDLVTFIATDPDGESDSDEVTFEVTPVNDLPVVSDIPNQEVAEGASFATINLDDYVTDIDNAINTMTWTASGQSNLSVNITDRVATITANDGNWNGDETITFQAADPSGGTDSDQATFTVTPVNDPPVIDDIPHQSILQGESFAPINLDDYVADPDDADNTLAWSVSGDAQVTVDITDRVATVTVNDAQWNGADWVIFAVEDPDGAEDRDTVRFHVADSNDPPVVEGIPDQTIAEGQLFSQISLDNYVTDPDDTDESITWVATGLTNLSVSIVNRVASVTPVDPDWNGAESIVFLAEDPMGEQDSDTAIFTITPTNDPPVVSGIPDFEVEEGTNFQETINLDAQVADIDNDDSELTWTIDGDSNVTVTILSRIAYITPGDNPDWNGIDTLVFTATDPSGAIGRDTCLFTVTGVQDAPRIGKAIPDTIARVDQVFSMVLDSTSLVDVDPGDSLAYSAVISKGGITPSWITFEPVTRTFSGTPSIADTGVVEVIVTATDDSLASVTDTFLIEVTTATGVVNPLDGLEIKLYPNPNDGRFVIEGEMFELRDVVLEIFNERGQLVWNRKIMDEIGTLRESVDLSNAADGLYLLRIRNKSGMVNKRFVKGY